MINIKMEKIYGQIIQIIKKLKIKLQILIINLYLKIINKLVNKLINKLNLHHKNPYNKKLKPLFNNLQFNHQLHLYNNNLKN